MEDRSSVGISIRNVPVRLNEGKVENETITECKKTLYESASSDSDTQVSHFNETSRSPNSLDESSGISNSHDHHNADDCDLINGCSDFLQKDLKCVHISVNGLNKCNNYELLNARIGELNKVRCDHPFDSTDMIRTEQNTTDCQNSLATAENSVHTEDTICHDGESNTNEKENVECSLSIESSCTKEADILYLGYDSENQMPDIIRLIQKDLSEPYSIYTYRYFIHNWPKLCFLALHRNQCVGAIVCKLDVHKKHSRRGYIAMLAVDENYRKRKIGSNLVLKAIDAMVEDNADEVVLETEITNKPALKLYENLGFVRDKRLFRYYLNGVDALRLKLWLR